MAYWTPEETSWLWANRALPIAELVAALGRTEPSINSKLQHMRRSAGIAALPYPTPRALSAPRPTGTPPPTVPTTPPANTDDLDGAILTALGRGPQSIGDLADLLDRGPGRIAEGVARLRDAGYMVDVLHGEAQIVAPVPTGRVAIPLEHFSGNRYRLGVVSDTHLGNRHARLDVLHAAYDKFAQEGITTVLHGGNWIDGEMRSGKNQMELLCRGGYESQVEYFLDNYPQRSGMRTLIVDGDDHEGWYFQDAGIMPGKRMVQSARDRGRDDLHYLGYYEVDIPFTASGRDPEPGEPAAILRLFHGGGGSAYAVSYKPQKVIEAWDAADRPAIAVMGHHHKIEYLRWLGVDVIQAGCMTDQSLFLKKKNVSVAVGFWILEFVVGDDGLVREFVPRLFHFRDRGYYQNRYGDGQADPVPSMAS